MVTADILDGNPSAPQYICEMLMDLVEPKKLHQLAQLMERKSWERLSVEELLDGG